MARVIGGTKTWMWWLGGCLCALVFGDLARAGELIREIAKYGAPARPIRPAVTEEQRKKAEKLVDQYLAPVAATEPDEAAAKEITASVKDLGSDDFRKRKAASDVLVKHGTAALGALRKAAESEDAEVKTRARAAVASIEAAARKGYVDDLKKIQTAARMVIGQRRTAAYHAMRTAHDAEAKAKKTGDRKAEEQARAERLAASATVGALSGLSRQVSPQPSKMRFRYGVRART